MDKRSCLQNYSWQLAKAMIYVKKQACELNVLSTRGTVYMTLYTKSTVFKYKSHLVVSCKNVK